MRGFIVIGSVMFSSRNHVVGTTHPGTVISDNEHCLFVEDDHGEGHTVVDPFRDFDAEVGDHGILTFTRAGVWAFRKNPKEAAIIRRALRLQEKSQALLLLCEKLRGR